MVVHLHWACVRCAGVEGVGGGCSGRVASVSGGGRLRGAWNCGITAAQGVIGGPPIREGPYHYLLLSGKIALRHSTRKPS